MQLMTFSLPVFPLRQKSECLLSLEAYSQEQKKRICWCLAENITKQQHPASAPTESKVSSLCSAALMEPLLRALQGSEYPGAVLCSSDALGMVFVPGEEGVCI